MTVKLLEHSPAVLLTRKTLPRSWVVLLLDQWSETTTHQRWQTDKMQHRANYVPFVVLGLSTSTSISATLTSPTSVLHETKHPASTNKKNGDNENVRGNPLLDQPAWLEDFTENLVDDSVPAHRDAPASSSRESASEPRVKVVSGSGTHSIYTHFPKYKIARFQIAKFPEKAVNLEKIVDMLSHSTDSILSVQNQDFSGNRKDLTKVLGADVETKSHLH